MFGVKHSHLKFNEIGSLDMADNKQFNISVNLAYMTDALSTVVLKGVVVDLLYAEVLACQTIS